MKTSETGNYQLDGIDKQILKHQMDNVLNPVTMLAKEIGISNTAVHQRIKKLQDAGIVKENIAIINHEKLGYRTVAFVGVFMDKSSNYNKVVRELKKIPEVLEAYFTTGNYGIFIKIIALDNKHLMELLNDEIQQIQGVVRTETFISLDQPIGRQIEI